jgi:hypothetical protein
VHHITPDRLESLLREAGVLIDLFGDERPNTAEFLCRVSGLCVDAAALLQERDALLLLLGRVEESLAQRESLLPTETARELAAEVRAALALARRSS